MMGNLAVLTIHQSAFNDVTFMCCSWAAMWCVWIATRLNEPFSSLFPRAVFLSHLILSLIFLGGAVGKVTDGYWSGQVLYDIYFEGRDFWFLQYLSGDVVSGATSGSRDMAFSIGHHRRIHLLFSVVDAGAMGVCACRRNVVRDRVDE